MAAEEGVVRVSRREQTIACQVQGRATMRHSPALRQFVRQSVATGPIELRLDLRQCTYMDSTFLGTLVVLKRAIDGRGRLTLVSPSSQCQALLKQTGLDQLLAIGMAEDEPPQSEWTELTSEPDEDGFHHGIVEAHQHLATLPGPAGEAFRDVAAELTKAWEQRQTARA
jgi:anti-anti-sigma factor